MTLKEAVQKEFQDKGQTLAAMVRQFAELGWVPATSSNFSVRISCEDNLAVITQSGKDKLSITQKDMMLVDLEGAPVSPENAKPSAETLLHTTLYGYQSDIGAVLHTHSPAATLLSHMNLKAGHVAIEGMELLKAFRGNTTHETKEVFPIFPNTQDIRALSKDVLNYFEKNTSMKGYLIAGHGLYTWGQDLREAKRHLEAMEFLLQFKLQESQWRS